MTTHSTLSPSSSPATNYVLVIGTLDTIRDRGKAVITRAQRNDRRGKMEHLAIQVRSPYRGTFLLPLDIDPSVKGHEILRTAQEGVPIALDGEIQLIKRFDRNVIARTGALSTSQTSRTRLRMPIAGICWQATAPMCLKNFLRIPSGIVPWWIATRC